MFLRTNRKDQDSSDIQMESHDDFAVKSFICTFKEWVSRALKYRIYILWHHEENAYMHAFAYTKFDGQVFRYCSAYIYAEPFVYTVHTVHNILCVHPYIIHIHMVTVKLSTPPAFSEYSVQCTAVQSAQYPTLLLSVSGVCTTAHSSPADADQSPPVPQAVQR